MRSGWKLTVAMGFVGVVAVAAAAFAEVGTIEPPAAGLPEDRQEQRERRAHRDGPRGPHRRMVHGEFTVQLRDGSFATVIVDHGTVTDIDRGAKTLTLTRADGETVSVTASDETRVRKDGERASFDAIEEGDLVRVMQADRGDGSVVRMIAAKTPGEERPARPSSSTPPVGAGLLDG